MAPKLHLEQIQPRDRGLLLFAALCVLASAVAIVAVAIFATSALKDVATILAPPNAGAAGTAIGRISAAAAPSPDPPP